MTPQEAIQMLKVLAEEYDTGDRMMACVLGIEALEKQTPQEPIIDVDTHTIYGANGEQADAEMFAVYICPVCGNIVSVTNPTTDEWCAKCGQRIDWSEEE